MILSDECGSGPYEALVLVEDSALVDVPALLFAHLEEPPRVGAIVTYETVSVRLEKRTKAKPAAGVEWCWIGRTCLQRGQVAGRTIRRESNASRHTL